MPTAEGLAAELDPAAREREIAAHLSAALSYYDTLHLDEGLIRIAENPQWRESLAKRYGRNTDKVIQGRRQRRDENLESARAEFWAAYRLQNPDADEATEQAAYEQFETTFRGESEARRQKRADRQAIYNAKLQPQSEAELLVPGVVQEERVRPQFNPQARISLARALRADYQGIQPEDYADISFELTRSMHPTTLLSYLVGVRRHSKNSLRYFTEDRRWRSITFTPGEWDMVLRSSAQKYADASENRTENKRRADLEARKHVESLGEYEIDEDAPRRSGIHTIKTIEAKMSAYRTNILERQLDMVRRFQEASNHPGLARFGNESNMRQQLEFFLTFVVGDMIWAAAKVNKWNVKEEAARERAIRKAIFLPSSPETGRNNFRMLVDAAETWLQSKLEYCDSKEAEIKKYLQDHQTDEERLADEAQLQRPA
ncbi:MAG TPA: hypothetical protein VHB51_01145 [Candidatus Saccharimonadales bacterium]|nr:hypothetical protein [Candidatus Saccharimonadales bacterium]